MAAAAGLAVAAAEGAGDGAAGVCWGSAAAGSDNQVTSGASDGVEVLSCVLVTGSLFAWADNEGKRWTGWRMEAG